MQQYRVFPYLAAAYALKFTGRYMRKLFDELAQVHIVQPRRCSPATAR